MMKQKSLDSLTKSVSNGSWRLTRICKLKLVGSRINWHNSSKLFRYFMKIYLILGWFAQCSVFLQYFVSLFSECLAGRNHMCDWLLTARGTNPAPCWSTRRVSFNLISKIIAWQEFDVWSRQFDFACCNHVRKGGMVTPSQASGGDIQIIHLTVSARWFWWQHILCRQILLEGPWLGRQVGPSDHIFC